MAKSKIDRINLSCTQSTYAAYQEAADADVRSVIEWARVTLDLVAKHKISMKELRDLLENFEAHRAGKQ